MSSTGPRVLALDIGGTKLAAGIGHADGEITRQTSVATGAGDGARAVLRRAITLARECLEAELAAGGAVDAVGVSTMGYTREDRVELAPNVPGWHGLALPAALVQAFPEHRLVFGNDVKMAAEAEMAWGALAGVGDGVYLNLGTGVAAAIVAGGQLLQGAHGAAGEIGYTLFRGGEERRMAADGAAPLEEWYGGAGVARRVAGTDLPETVAEIVAVADEDPAADEFLTGLWNGIAVHAANLCIATDPEVLAVGGGYVRGSSDLMERIRGVVERAVPYPPTVVPARFGADASLRGAAAAALAIADAGRADGAASHRRVRA